MRHTDGNYYFGSPLYAHAGFPDEYIPRVVAFLKRLSVEIEQYYSFDRDRAITYEDLFYVAAQIHDSEMGEYDNPIAQAFIDKIMPDIKPLFVRHKNETRKQWKLHEIANEATHYIHDIVWHSLATEPANLDYLHCVKEVCQNIKLKSVDLFSLNHDIVIEQCFQAWDVKYTEGFGEPINGVRYWSPELFDVPSIKVRLFKLHGSVNWFLFRANAVSWRNEPVGIPLNGDFWHTKTQMASYKRLLMVAHAFSRYFQQNAAIYERNLRRSILSNVSCLARNRDSNRLWIPVLPIKV